MAEFDWFQRSATPPPAEADPQQDALAWAREAYARLKAQQQAGAAEVAPEPESEPESFVPPEPEPTPEHEPEPQPTPEPQPLLLEQAMAQRQERLAVLQTPEAPAVEDRQGDGDDPSLGALDDAFLWSAEVLAAQGRSVDDVSLDEIDWLSRLRRGMEKTRQGFVTGLLERLGTDPLSGDTLDEIESLLLRADVGVQATDRLLDRLRRRMNETVLEGPEALDLLRAELRQLLDAPLADGRSPLLAPRRGVLNIWLLVGVNGVGKTTTLGKLAHLAMRSGYSCLIAAGDTFRAAAVQQLQVWADRSAVPLIANPSANADPAAVVYDAIGAARSRGSELLLVDTAGRLQTKNNLMEELAKVRRIVDRLAPEACVESLLVLDASQGQNGLRQAMAFAPAAGLSGVVLTKLDGTARGGVALAVAAEAGLPIRFIGAGEGLRDLRPFNSFEFVEALLAR
jgi:fused signal recognition particle receptor